MQHATWRNSPPRKPPVYSFQEGDQHVEVVRIGVARQDVMYEYKCQTCGYTSHNDKFCPLRLCKLCGVHGHCHSVCGRAAPYQIFE